MKIKTIAFDADDTLWVNEPFFREAEEKFASLLEDYLPVHSSLKELYTREITNLPVYGYGIKGFMLSMIETAMEITSNNLPDQMIQSIIQIGRDMLAKPVELLPGVEELLQKLNGDFRLVLATKGDLLDQERKLKKSGLEKYFHHIEIMSEKKTANFQKLVKHLDIAPKQFLMVGNSLKSDILPVLDLGGHAIHIPFHITWVHERIEHEVKHPNFREAEKLSEVFDLISEMT
ncbi:HAD family hydrolase [Algoriphagus sediminis]|uniref:HAD family hydrolase n=1 Tax=Algoriphagus sediminis TaxID=3057113 RepID=A0ABT7Y7M3_9BACT|nr:HAD family hydrolase [Algoriphagus sediminis]MDN3202519.1 HAD family hydrolase [Algoriphagus sediminis]